MNVIKTKIDGVLIIEPKIFGDSRGFFLESYSERRYAEHGVSDRFVQDNISLSSKGVLRGLHFQDPKSQGKLVSVPMGAVFDVVVDVRKGSPTFGEWIGTHLDAESGRQVWIPPGMAHGFLVLSDKALFTYKCSDYYAPDCEHTILWNDPDIGIKWPMTEGLSLSAKDLAGKPIREFR